MNKKILFYRYNSICEPSVIHALVELGCIVDEITEEMTNKNLPPSDCLKLVNNKLKTTKYDGVFSINFFPIISEICNIYKIPYICWTVDCPIMELYSDAIKNPYNRIFLFDHAQYHEFSPKNPNCIFYLPLASYVKQFDNVINTITSKDDKYKSNISFIGSLYSEKCAYNQLTNLPPYLKGYLEGIMDAQLKVYGYNFVPELITKEICDEFNKFVLMYNFPEKSEKNYVAALAHNILSYKMGELERTRLLGKLSDIFNVDIYTGSDTSSLPNINNKGLINTFSDMPKAFHLSKINLNFTLKAIQTGLPLRIWDIMGCGGFVLTNYQEEIGEYFEIGKEIETFGSEAELIDKIGYYLEHEDERKQIALNGYNKVKENHTWVHRLAIILDVVFN